MPIYAQLLLLQKNQLLEEEKLAKREEVEELKIFFGTLLCHPIYKKMINFCSSVYILALVLSIFVSLQRN